ncbi:hypothetical protein JAAARDRAFT_335206 [Jaapia argillacea MUCL 33604]|uniref:Peptidase C14 caspase domain-containing protein n=1 Tax=Jaapia argillacea MUCL 33604 TaxID=933084 RepID=A0A067PVS3_9AGAM|nr:hypothetical protein JAAARDRAFT_335206 [Jaapia argillacea MUCL 33604]
MVSYQSITPTAADTQSRRPPIKRALLIGVTYLEDPLKGPQDDVAKLYALLLNHYEYSKDNITLMLDDQSPEYVPTFVNVTRELKNLVTDAEPGDRFLFFYAGHGDQQDTDDVNEEDGKDECLVCADGVLIVDNFLKETLVDPLPPHCTLTAIFDCCHSGTMLDLGHYHNPLEEWERRAKHLAVSVPLAAPRSRSLRQPFQGRLFQERRLNSEMVQSHKLSLDEAPVSHVQVTGESSSFKSKLRSFSEYRGPPPEATGWISESHTRSLSPEPRPASPEAPDVFSLGSCMDDQLAWGSKEGGFFTWALLQALEANPHPTLGELLSRIHSLIRDMVKNMMKARPDLEVDKLEPSLGGHHTLDMAARFSL